MFVLEQICFINIPFSVFLSRGEFKSKISIDDYEYESKSHFNHKISILCIHRLHLISKFRNLLFAHFISLAATTKFNWLTVRILSNQRTMRQTKPDERANGIENVKYFSFGMFKSMPIYSAGSGFKIKPQPQSFVAFNFYY